MLSKNLLKQSIDINLFFSVVTDQIFKDERFVQLMNMLIKPENLNKYTGTIYTDSNMLTTNIFIPIFHTLYIGCKNNNVVLESQEDIWVPSVFPNNKYFILKPQNDDTNYGEYGISVIDHIEEVVS